MTATLRNLLRAPWPTVTPPPAPTRTQLPQLVAAATARHARLAERAG